MIRPIVFLLSFSLLGMSLRAEEQDRGTRFAVAIEDHDLDAVKALLDGGAPADTPIVYGEASITPLMKAAWDGDLPIVQLLLARGANVNFRTADSNETALMNAVTQGSLEIVQALIAAHADVKPRNRFDFNAFTSAVAAGKEEIAAELIKAGADLNEGASGLTPLAFAASAGSDSMMRFLVQHGADVNYGAREGKQTALMTAVVSGKLDSVKTLIALKADVNARMKDGDTPLKMAQKGDQAEMIALLKAAGAKR